MSEIDVQTAYKRKELCSGCGVCFNSCSVNAIKMIKDEEGFAYPQINKEICINCRKCQLICPFHESEKGILTDVYAGKNKSEEVRKNSASGGIFSVLSDYILVNNGVVYGAIFDKKYNVIHQRTESTDGRNLMRGSKYIQSNIEKVYGQLKDDLESGRKVLFVGTPCQIAGVKAYLTKEYANLILCDIVCHGVSSSKVFQDFISYIEDKYSSKIEKISFRDKNQGWSNQKWKINLKSGVELIDNQDVNIYKNLYYKHLIHRPSCHECVFANMKRQGDITLGDFWGIEKIMPEFIDDFGVSLIIVNTNKGKKIFNCVKDGIEYLKSDEYNCLQPQLQYPTEKSKNRSEFWKDYRKYNFLHIAKKYGGIGLKSRIKYKVKNIFNKK